LNVTSFDDSRAFPYYEIHFSDLGGSEIIPFSENAGLRVNVATEGNLNAFSWLFGSMSFHKLFSNFFWEEKSTLTQWLTI